MAARVLYAEDDEGSRELVATALRDAGYAVDTARDGGGALALLEGESYDLVLLDIRMPGMGGIDVLRHIRQKNLQPRVIMLTAVDELSVAIECVKLGANDYLTKPFRLEDLHEAVARVLQR